MDGTRIRSLLAEASRAPRSSKGSAVSGGRTSSSAAGGGASSRQAACDHIRAYLTTNYSTLEICYVLFELLEMLSLEENHRDDEDAAADPHGREDAEAAALRLTPQLPDEASSSSVLPAASATPSMSASVENKKIGSSKKKMQKASKGTAASVDLHLGVKIVTSLVGARLSTGKLFDEEGSLTSCTTRSAIRNAFESWLARPLALGLLPPHCVFLMFAANVGFRPNKELLRQYALRKTVTEFCELVGAAFPRVAAGRARASSKASASSSGAGSTWVDADAGKMEDSAQGEAASQDTTTESEEETQANLELFRLLLTRHVDDVNTRVHQGSDASTGAEAARPPPRQQLHFPYHHLAGCCDSWRLAAILARPNLRVAQDWAVWRQPAVWRLLQTNFGDREDAAVTAHLGLEVAGGRLDKVKDQIEIDTPATLDLERWISASASSTTPGARDVDFTEEQGEDNVRAPAQNKAFWISAKATKDVRKLPQAFWEEHECALDCEWWNPRPLSLLQLSVRERGSQKQVVTLLFDMAELFSVPDSAGDGDATTRAAVEGKTKSGEQKLEVVAGAEDFSLARIMITDWLRDALTRSHRVFVFSGNEDYRRLRICGVIPPDAREKGNGVGEAGVQNGNSVSNKYKPTTRNKGKQRTGEDMDNDNKALYLFEALAARSATCVVPGPKGPPKGVGKKGAASNKRGRATAPKSKGKKETASGAPDTSTSVELAETSASAATTMRTTCGFNSEKTTLNSPSHFAASSSSSTRYDYRYRPRNWVDVQMKFFPGKTPSLERLALEYLDEGLDKMVRESNWERRPLCEKQLAYAIRDASVLFDLFDALSRDQQGSGAAAKKQGENGIPAAGGASSSSASGASDDGMGLGLGEAAALGCTTSSSTARSSSRSGRIRINHFPDGNPFRSRPHQFCAHEQECKLIRKFRGLGIDILPVPGKVTQLRPLPGRVLLLRDPLVGKRNKIKQIELEEKSAADERNASSSAVASSTSEQGEPEQASGLGPPGGIDWGTATGRAGKARDEHHEQPDWIASCSSSSSFDAAAAVVDPGEASKLPPATPPSSTTVTTAPPRTSTGITGKQNPVSFLPNVYTIHAGPKIIDMVLEVVKFFEIDIRPQDFCNRCVDCNANDWLLTDKEDVKDEVMENVYETQTVFYRCGGCRKVYWEGVTFDRACADLEKFFPALKAEEVRGVRMVDSAGGGVVVPSISPSEEEEGGAQAKGGS